MPTGARKIAARIVLGLALLVGLAVALLPPFFRTESGRRLVERYLTRKLGFDVDIGELRVGYDLSVWVAGVSAHGGAAEPFLTAENARLTIRPSLASLVAVRAETFSPHLYVDRFPLPAPGDEERGARFDEMWLPALDVDVRDGFVHQGDRILGPVEARFAPDPLSGANRLKATTHLGAAENEIRWTIDPHVAERRAIVAAEGRIGDLPGLLRAGALATAEPLTGKADLRLEGEVFWEAAGKSRADGKLFIENLEGHDEELVRAFKGVKASASIEAKLAPGEDPRAEVEVATERGEVLWERFYIDLAQHALKMRLSGRRDGRLFRVDKASAALAGIATAQASGAYDAKGGPSIESTIDVADLSSLYRVGIQEPFRELHPALGDSTVGGRLRARVSYTEKGGKMRSAGVIEISGGVVDAESPEVRVRGLELNVPFQIGAIAGGKRDHGFVRAAELSLGGVRVADLALDLVTEPDSISLEHPVRLAVLGGVVDLDHLSADALGDPARHARLGVSLHGLDLRELSKALGGPPLSGTITGAIPEIRVGDGSIASEGRIDIEAFDGAIAVRDLRIDQVLSPVPELTLDAGFDDVSLGRLTQELEVGKVTGVARGGVEHLVMTRGEPVQFDAWMETVSKSGVSQKISVMALRQLSIIGGSEADPISRGVLSFFDEYGYAKMGLRCSLRNDRFTLHGVESADGKEYLVVGSRLPPSVNVVSHTQVISFSEMVRRLSRATEVGKSSPTPAGEAEGSVQ